jgi:hypothetical protein
VWIGGEDRWGGPVGRSGGEEELRGGVVGGEFSGGAVGGKQAVVRRSYGEERWEGAVGRSGGNDPR